jgi:hypothetical protein
MSVLKTLLKKPITWIVERSAKTGRFVKKGTSKKAPDTTVREKMKRDK